MRSVAQAKKPGTGTGGNKGFPDVAGKTGSGQVAGKVQGAKGSQFAGKVQGGQDAGQLGKNFSPERNQAIANRQQYWDKWGKDNQGKLADFRTNQGKDWNNISNFRNSQNLANSFNKPEWNNYKNNVNAFRNDRSIEINNNIQNRFDNNFNDNWWGSCGWYRSSNYWGGNPWWWWGAATVASVGTFLAIDAIQSATYQPPIYDYGVNVVYQGDEAPLSKPERRT